MKQPALARDEPPAFDLLVISTDDWFVHTFPDADAMLKETDIGRDVERLALEFFDAAGYRLAPEFNGDWKLTGLRRTAERPRPGHVRRRLRTWVRNLRTHIRANGQPNETASPDDEGLLPRLRGTDLRVWLAQVDATVNWLGGPDTRGDAWHNWLHTIGLAH